MGANTTDTDHEPTTSDAGFAPPAAMALPSSPQPQAPDEDEPDPDGSATEPTETDAGQEPPDDSDDPQTPEDDAGLTGEPAKGGTTDKALQHLQQRQAQDRQRIEEMSSGMSRIEQLLSQMATRPADPAPASQKQADKADQAVQQATQQADSLLKELEEVTTFDAADDEIVDVGQIKQRFGKLKNVLERLAQGAKPSDSNGQVAELQSKIDALGKQLQQQQQQTAQEHAKAQAAAYWSTFNQDNGFDGESKWNELIKASLEKYPDNPVAAQEVASTKFEFWTEQEKASRSAQPKTQTPPGSRRQRPPGTQPPKSTAGTQTTTPGASAGGPSDGVEYTGDGGFIAKPPPI